MRLPVPLLKESVGLGDVVKAATQAVGVRPCGGCARRAAALNRAVTLAPLSDLRARAGKPFTAQLPDVLVGGAVPPGMTVSGRSLHGTPTQPGLYTMQTPRGDVTLEVA